MRLRLVGVSFPLIFLWSCGDAGGDPLDMGELVDPPRVLQPNELCVGSPGTTIATFEDEHLETAVRAALGLGSGESITCSLGSALVELDASTLGITSLVGTQNLTGLTRLLLNENPNLFDVQPLIDNEGLGASDLVNLSSTNVSCSDVAKLQIKGAIVLSDCVARIAFQRDRLADQEVYVMNADGSNQVNLTNNAVEDFMPAWSPDGSTIAFGSLRDGNSEIYVMNSDGSNYINLTNNMARDNAPAWSPDGSLIAFGSDRNGNPEIHVMGADGSNHLNITNNPADD